MRLFNQAGSSKPSDDSMNNTETELELKVESLRGRFKTKTISLYVLQTPIVLQYND